MSDTGPTDSESLLAKLAARDKAFKWTPVFQAAAAQTEARVLALTSGPTLQERRIETGDLLINISGVAVMLAVTILPMAALIGQVLLHTSLVFALILFPGLGAVCALAAGTAGTIQHLRARSRRADNKNVVLPPLVEIEPIVPDPIRYRLRSTLGPEGELLAVLTRHYPKVIEGHVQAWKDTFAPIRLGNDEDAGELSESFAVLLAEVRELERAAARPYTRFLTQHGLAEEQLPDTKAKLCERVERSRERQQLNSGVAGVLNQQDGETLPLGVRVIAPPQLAAQKVVL